MSLEIVKIHKNGDASQEYLLLKATETINAHNYAIIDRTFDHDGKVSNIYRHYYQFPSQIVKKGDYVSLRTGKGQYEFDKLSDGSPVHRFYWGSDAPIWNDEEIDKAEVLQVKTVSTMSTGNTSPKRKLKK